MARAGLYYVVPGEVSDVVELCQPQHGQGWAILVPGEVRDVVELCQLDPWPGLGYTSTWGSKGCCRTMPARPMARAGLY